MKYLKFSAIYLIVLSAFVITAFFWQNKFLDGVVCLVFLLPLFYIVYKASRKIYLLVSILSFGGALFTFLIFFRKIRDALPPPIINQTKIIGYTHYFGYPFLLDTVVFFFFIFFPVGIFILLYSIDVWKKYKRK
jgi:hypothetical protein